VQCIDGRRPYAQCGLDARAQQKISFEVIALGFIIILCALLRFYHIGAASLWSDGIFSRYYLDLFGLHYVLTDGLSRETNPPTYYLLLRGWMSLFGDSEAALRSLSAATSILCVPVTYLLGRELGGKSRFSGCSSLRALPGKLVFRPRGKGLCPIHVGLHGRSVGRRGVRT
jgi:hypothetical protein